MKKKFLISLILVLQLSVVWADNNYQWKYYNEKLIYHVSSDSVKKTQTGKVSEITDPFVIMVSPSSKAILWLYSINIKATPTSLKISPDYFSNPDDYVEIQFDIPSSTREIEIEKTKQTYKSILVSKDYDILQTLLSNSNSLDIVVEYSDKTSIITNLNCKYLYLYLFRDFD